MLPPHRWVGVDIRSSGARRCRWGATNNRLLAAAGRPALHCPSQARHDGMPFSSNTRAHKREWPSLTGCKPTTLGMCACST